jgi:hypothetical protein
MSSSIFAYLHLAGYRDLLRDNGDGGGRGALARNAGQAYPRRVEKRGADGNCGRCGSVRRRRCIRKRSAQECRRSGPRWEGGGVAATLCYFKVGWDEHATAVLCKIVGLSVRAEAKAVGPGIQEFPRSIRPKLPST